MLELTHQRTARHAANARFGPRFEGRILLWRSLAVVIYFAPDRGGSIAMSMSVCLSVCLSARLSRKPYNRSSPNFIRVPIMVAARSSSGGVAICYAIPVLSMTSLRTLRCVMSIRKRLQPKLLHRLPRNFAQRQRSACTHRGWHTAGGGEVCYARLALVCCGIAL